jgi:hypothetical protein
LQLRPWLDARDQAAYGRLTAAQLAAPRLRMLTAAFSSACATTSQTHRTSAYLLHSEPVQAAREAEEVYEITPRIGSARVDERFGELVPALRPYDLPEAHDLLERVTENRPPGSP